MKCDRPRQVFHNVGRGKGEGEGGGRRGREKGSGSLAKE